MRITNLLVPLSLLIASTSLAQQPPGAAKRGLRDGANHHTGDPGFIEALGRAPRPGDDEKLRMRLHFKHVRAWLASRPATRPELQAKRDQLLEYLDQYITKGITPKNIDVAWRTPVFIDHENTICAVGYLIEQSTGRALPEKIAATHRLSYIEDIARVMPEVRAWVEASGMTLDEIASIQPGYEGPEIDQYRRWVLAKLPNGPYEATESGFQLAGTFRRHQMQGTWTKTDDKEVLRGSGTFRAGSGTWRSNYKSGARMAEGLFADSHPTGTWRFYHPSGNLAAEGRLEGTDRRGVWRFYNDTADKTLFAKGDFRSSKWQYFDEAGALVASTASAEPTQWSKGWASLVTVKPGADGVRYQRNAGRIGGGNDGMSRSWASSLESFALGNERVFAYEHERPASEDAEETTDKDTKATYDAGGHKLEKVDGVWQASDCKWSAARKQAARNEDVVRLHGLLTGSDDEVCAAPVAVPAERARQIEIALATRHKARAPIPAFVDKLADYENDQPDTSEAVADVVVTTPNEPDTKVADLVSFVAGGTSYHFDTRFIEVFRTIPGTKHRFE